MNITTIRTTGAIVIVIAIVSAASLWKSLPHAGEGASGAQGATAAGTLPEAETPARTSRPASGSAATRVPHSKQSGGTIAGDDAWVHEYGCATCEDGFAVPRTREEANWLAAHGFPSRTQREHAQSLGIDDLRQRTRARDLVSAGLLADRLREERNVDAVLAYEDAAMLGSVYALYRLADYYRDQGTGLFFQYQHAAYLRIAGARGDYFASAELRKRFPQFSMGDVEIADRHAAILLSNWEETSTLRGWPKLTIHPRPHARQHVADVPRTDG